jgi:hypothetical protein
MKMGASGWSYFTPCQENIGKAFQELQQKVGMKLFPILPNTQDAKIRN